MEDAAYDEVLVTLLNEKELEAWYFVKINE